MRILGFAILLIAIAGCPSKSRTVHHTLPANFSGVYVIQKGHEDSNSYKVDGNRYIFEIPKSGILKVTPDAFENYCFNITNCKSNVKLTVSFPDGKPIAMYSPLSSPANPESETPMLHATFGARDSIWFTIGNYKQLKEFDDKFRKELPERAKLSQYAGLEEYLPPNTPFQADANAGKD